MQWRSLRLIYDTTSLKRTFPYRVPLLVVDILDDEDHVETGQNGGHEINILICLDVVPATEHAVGSSEHRASGIEGCCDASLG